MWSIWINDWKSIEELNIFMAKLFKQNFFVSLFEELFTRQKASSIFAATVFNAAISLFYSWKFCFSSGCLLNSPQKNTDSHFANLASAIELCDFFHGNYYSGLTGCFQARMLHLLTQLPCFNISFFNISFFNIVKDYSRYPTEIPLLISFSKL